MLSLKATIHSVRGPLWLTLAFLLVAFSTRKTLAGPCDVTPQATDTTISAQTVVYNTPQIFPGRVIIRNGASVSFTGPAAPPAGNTAIFNGDVYVCDNSTLSFGNTLVISSMSYAHQYQFLINNNSSLIFSTVTFANIGRNIGDINLSTNSTLSLYNVNRNVTDAQLLATVAGMTIVLDKSTASVNASFDTNPLALLEFAALYGSSRLTVTDTQILVLWMTFRGANVGGTIALPATTPATDPFVPFIGNWRLDNTVISNLPYSVQLTSVSFAAFGTIAFSEPPSGSSLTYQGGTLLAGIGLINESNAALSNLTEGTQTNLSVSLPHRALQFTNTKIYTWNVYTAYSTVSISGGQIGEILAYAPSTIQATGSQLTAAGGYYSTQVLEEAPTSSATITLTNCTFRDTTGTPVTLVARSRGHILVDNGVFSPASRHGVTADGGLLQIRNSSIANLVSTSAINSGTIWISSAVTTFQTQSDGSRLVTITGDSIIYPTSSFSNYTLDYAPAQFSSQRTTLLTSNTPVRNGTLYSGTVSPDFPSKAQVNLTLRDTTGRTLTASSFTPISASTFAVVFDDIHPYPVPFQPGLDASHQQITFANTPPGTMIKIYTVTGQLVRELPAAAANGQVLWDVKNADGEKVVSDVYLYVARLGDSKKTGKLVIIR